MSTAVSTESDDSDVKQIKAAIKKTVASRPKDWVSVLVLLTLSINCTVQRYSHVSAYSTFMGRRANLPLDCLYGLEMTPFFQEERNGAVTFFHNVRNMARVLHAEKLITIEYARTYANKNSLVVDLEPGQAVLMQRPPPKGVKFRGLQFKWCGPYFVTERIGRSLYVVTDGHKFITAHQDQMKLLRGELRRTEPALPLSTGRLPCYVPPRKTQEMKIGGAKEEERKKANKTASFSTGANLEDYFEPQALDTAPVKRLRKKATRMIVDPSKKSYD